MCSGNKQGGARSTREAQESDAADDISSAVSRNCCNACARETLSAGVGSKFHCAFPHAPDVRGQHDGRIRVSYGCLILFFFFWWRWMPDRPEEGAGTGLGCDGKIRSQRDDTQYL